MNNSLSSVLLAALLSSVSGAALSQTVDTGENATPLERVVVTATSLEQTLPETLGRYGSTLETVTEEEIERGGYIDVGQALEMLVPGAFVSTQAGPFSYLNVSVQGSRTSDMLWTVDGVRINNRLYNSTSPADTLPSSMIERLEVLKGGQGLFYGTQAVGGVINVVTRSFSDTPGGEVSIGADTFNGVHANAYFRDGFGPHKLVVWASKDESDGYELYTDYQPNTTTRKRSYDVNSYGAKYGLDITDDLSVSAMYIRTIANLDYPSVRGNSVNDRDEDIVSAKIDYLPSEELQLFLKAYYHSWDTDYYTKPNPSEYWGYKDFGVNGLAQFRLHRGFEYNVGYDFQNYRGRDEVLLIAGETEQVHAVFAQVRSTDDLSKRARFAAGFRVNETSGGTHTVWNVSGVYDITDTLFVEGTAGTSFLLPDAEQLYGIDPCCTHGNPDLEPETSTNLNLSIGGRLGAADKPVQWRVSAWARQIENLILEDTSNPPDGYDSIYVNVDDKVDVAGAELVVKAPLTSEWSVDGSYTYSRERARGTHTQIAGRPETTAKLGVSYTSAALPVGLDLAAKYVGPTQTNVTGFGTQAYGDYVVVNLSGHVFFGQDGQTRLTAKVENLLDEDYASTVSSAVRTGTTTRFLYRRLGAPRMASVSLTHRF